MRDNILEIIAEAEKTAKTANKHNQSLLGNNFYASKFSELHAEVIVAFKKLKQKLNKSDDKNITDSLISLETAIDSFFDPKNKVPIKSKIKKDITFIFQTVINPAVTIHPPHIPTDDLFPLEIIKNTRGYIEIIADQACGAYDQGWYDACAVMARRLLEILIIESFESHKLAAKIQKPDGTFFYLQDLVTLTLNESSWTIGRNVKKALPNLKDIGNQSAHGRRYIARKSDIDNIKRELRLTIEELVLLSGLRK